MSVKQIEVPMKKKSDHKLVTRFNSVDENAAVTSTYVSKTDLDNLAGYDGETLTIVVKP